jgi:hypothetical protein
MKKILVCLMSIVFLFTMAKMALAATYFFDDFEDGTLDGYTFINGNWFIEDGVLKQQSWQGTVALVNGQEYTDQIIEADINNEGDYCSSGYMFWFIDPGNSISILVDTFFDNIRVIEKIGWSTTDYVYHLDVNNRQWYDFRLNADSTTGKIDIYLDDTYLLTHNSQIVQRMGSSGFITGCNFLSPNPVIFFDNFSITPAPHLTDKKQCKDGGWKTFSNPTFKNQGDCVSYVQSNPNAKGNKAK